MRFLGEASPPQTPPRNSCQSKVFALDPDQIVAWLAERYGDAFSGASAELFRSYTNDVYLIHSAAQKSVLKLYGLGWRTTSEIHWELDLARHVAGLGVPVAEPIAAQDQKLIQSVATHAGERIAVLFAYVPGDKPQPPFSTDLYERFGQAIARLHAAADSFVALHPHRNLDAAVLIDQPMALAAPLLIHSHERDWLVELANIVKQHIAAYAAAGLDWGPIHGDATLDNLHLTEDGSIILYDFDLAGPGWRAADLQGWAANHPEYQSRWDAFHRGYSRVRLLPEIDRAAAPYLTLAWDIWAIQIDLERRILSQGPEQVQKYLGEQLELLRWRSKQVGIICRSSAL
jgi:Ser/Thr protein kinase RdoA (MazF antagonist)